MKICLQDPNIPYSYNLHEEIIQASNEATCGGGVFAFATSGGVHLLIEDKKFIKYLIKHDFKLLVGTDEITSTHTINTLNTLITQYPTFEVMAFVNNDRSAIFHPKYCWFRKPKGGVIIIGSGNLTQRGLTRNWETFSVHQVDLHQITTFEEQWEQWYELNRGSIYAIDDPIVLERVSENKIQSKKRHRERKQTHETNLHPSIDSSDIENEDIEAWYFGETCEVLVAELPKASDRWQQANFDQNSFQYFFGATPGDNTLRVVFKGITTNGILQKTEIRPSISVKSSNWRFELDLAKGKEYPNDYNVIGRPIGVFFKISRRMFLYMLMMPYDDTYGDILGLLNSNGGSGIRRTIYSASDVRKACPGLAAFRLIDNSI